MKKLLNLKTFALIISAVTLMSLASCDAAPDLGNLANKNEGAMDGILGGSDGNYVPPNYEIAPDASVDMEGGVKGDEMIEAPSENGKPNESEDESDANTSIFVENPFVNTSENNVSTFSADVDTASYSYFRKLVNGGYKFNSLKNGGSSFRTEEFINYFKYDVAGPKDGEIFGVYSEMTACPWNSDNMLLRVTLQTEIPKDEKANNLVFLIDVSGSMSSRDKLPLLKTAFSYLVSNLDGNDTVSIVTYSGKEAIVLDGCNGLDSVTIMNAINSLTASGSTNGEAGLTMAYQIAEKHFKADGNNRIIMASDGDLNVGISSADQLTAYIEEKRGQGVYLSVLGFGTGNYKDANMEALADNGNGIYYYIDGETEAEKVFGSDLLGTLYTVAEDVKLQLEFNSEAIKSYRLIGYENRVMNNEDFENDKKDAGEVGASHQVTVCYEIEPTRTEQVHGYYMILRVRYKNPGESLSLLNEYTLGNEMIKATPSTDTRFITAVIETCMLLHNSQYAKGITLTTIYDSIKGLDLGGNSYKEEFREMIKAFALAEVPLDGGEVLTPEDITESPDGSCDNDSGMVSEGRLYFSGSAKNEALLVEGGSLTWLYCDKAGAFEGFDTGDLVRVAHGYVMESYPGQTYISQIALVENGDIYSFTDEEWERLGWIFADPPER